MNEWARVTDSRCLSYLSCDGRERGDTSRGAGKRRRLSQKEGVHKRARVIDSRCLSFLS